MPNYDGTGPDGKGPRKGRQKYGGNCGQGNGGRGYGGNCGQGQGNRTCDGQGNGQGQRQGNKGKDITDIIDSE